MKSIFKYLIVFATILLGFVSCKDELIPSKDAYSDYKGVTGDFAYIVGGTTAAYDAAHATVQHTTTLGDLGTVAKTFKVALTKAQDADVTITLGVDNNALTGSYVAFPDGFLKYPQTVTIPAGELEATVEVTSEQKDLKNLVEPSYMAVFRIVGATGVKVSTNSNTALLYVSTENINPADNLISIGDDEAAFKVSNYTDTQRGDDINVDIEVKGSEEAFQEFTVTLDVDNSLIAAYNEKNGTSYISVPDGVVTIQNAVMAKDAKQANANVSISEENRAQLTDANGYLIPIKVVDVADATLSNESGVVYIVVSVVNFDTSSDMFSALYLGDYRMATWYKFPNGLNLSNGYTYVFHVFLDEITPHSRIGNFSDDHEGWINMLRYGQMGNNDTRLEWWVGPGACRKKLYAPAIEAKKWYQYALVYDLDSYKMYLEGELVAEVTLTEDDKAVLSKNPPVFQAIEFNSSWVAGYRPGNELHGRLWNFSVWQVALDTGDISNCYRGMTDYYQMVINYYGAYWAFDDGYGHIVKQTAGKQMGDIDFSKTTRVEDEGSGAYEDADVSQYVQWKTDEYNRFE